MKITSILFIISITAISCAGDKQVPDAYGNFTAEEILISAEVSGRILARHFQEGEQVQINDLVYQLDSVQPYLKLQEARARVRALQARKNNITAQIEVIEEQIRVGEEELSRFMKIHREGAVSDKQIDDLKNQLSLLKKQKNQVETNYLSLEAELEAAGTVVNQAHDGLTRTQVRAPVAGTIIETYTNPGELVTPGKPLFKMVDLEFLELKAYFSGGQLPLLKLGQEVRVQVDDGKGGLKTFEGEVSWIASNAEFTPKVIQTREERVSLVYAVKIRVKNDGSLKINMPGEVVLPS